MEILGTRLPRISAVLPFRTAVIVTVILGAQPEWGGRNLHKRLQSFRLLFCKPSEIWFGLIWQMIFLIEVETLHFHKFSLQTFGNVYYILVLGRLVVKEKLILKGCCRIRLFQTRHTWCCNCSKKTLRSDLSSTNNLQDKFLRALQLRGLTSKQTWNGSDICVHCTISKCLTISCIAHRKR